MFNWNVEEAFEKYSTGKSLKEIGRKYGLSYHGVRYAFKRTFGEKYLRISKSRLPKRYLDKKGIKKIFDEYKSGKSVYNLAGKYRVPDQVLYDYFKRIPEYNKISNLRKIKRHVSQTDVQKAYNLYKKGVSLENLAKSFKIGRDTLSKYFRMVSEDKYTELSKKNRFRSSLNNVKLAVQKNQVVTQDIIQEIIRMRREGNSIYKIAEKLMISPPTVTL